MNTLQKIFSAAVMIFMAGTCLFAQNIAINTDGTAAETNVMLDLKGTNAIGTTATQNIFQIKSFDVSGSELKFRLVLGTHATAGSRFGALEVYDAGAAAYRNLSLQPSGGSVGIGITNPARLLHLQGNNAVIRIDRDADSPGILYTRTAGGSFSTVWKTFSMGTSATGVNNGTFDISDLGSAVSGAGTPRLTIDNVGYVGISASAPSARLQVGTTSSDGRANGIQLGDAASYKYHIYQQTNLSGSIQNSLVIDANGDVDLRQTLGTNNGTGYIVFMTGAGTGAGGTGASKEQMRISPLGYVGIGTTTPSGKFEIVNTAGGYVSANYLQITGTTADNLNYPGLSMKGGTLATTYPSVSLTNGGLGAIIYSGAAAGYPNQMYGLFDAGSSFVQFGKVGSPYMTINSVGNVGIGTTSPAAKFHVDGLTGRQTITGGATAWVDLSSNAAGRGLLGGNMYTDWTGSTFHYSATHGSIGAVGFATNYPVWNQASVITSGTTASTAGTAFAPTVIATFDYTGNVGIGTTTPNTKLQVAGGVSLPITVSGGAKTLDNTCYTFIMTAAADIPTIPAPASPGNVGWTFVLINLTTLPITLGAGGTYIDFTGTAVTTIPSKKNVTIQSDGTNWYQVAGR